MKMESFCFEEYLNIQVLWGYLNNLEQKLELTLGENTHWKTSLVVHAEERKHPDCCWELT